MGFVLRRLTFPDGRGIGFLMLRQQLDTWRCIYVYINIYIYIYIHGLMAYGYIVLVGVISRIIRVVSTFAMTPFVALLTLYL